MSHPNQLAFVQAAVALVREHGLSEAPVVAEIGSYDVNGTVRSLVGPCRSYVGVDLVAGPGVDVVMSGHEFGDSNAFDLVLCSEVFEHNPFWLETFLNMLRIAKPGGAVIVTCATHGRYEHGTARTDPNASPGTSARGWQYYRNLTKRDFTARVELEHHLACHRFYTVRSSSDLYFIGTKRRARYDEHETSWLHDHTGELDALANRLDGEQPPTALRDLPLEAARRVLPDAAFQQVWAAYLRLARRFGRSARERRP